MRTISKSLAVFLVLACWLFGCEVSPSSAVSSKELEVQRLVPYMPSEHAAVSSQVEVSGQVKEAYVRHEAFVEWRVLDREPGRLAAAEEWRPLVSGVGVGE